MTSIRGRPSSLGGHDLEAGDPPRRLVPARPAADQRQDLGQVVALGAHRRGAPHGEPDAARVGPGVGQVPGQQRVGQRGADLPGAAGRDRLRVDGVEVAPGRQHVDQPAGRRAGRPGRHVAAVQGVQHVGDLVGGAVQPRAPPRRSRTPAPRRRRAPPPPAARAPPPPGRSQPARLHAGDQRPGHPLQHVDESAPVTAGPGATSASRARRAVNSPAAAGTGAPGAASSACSSRPAQPASAARRPGSARRPPHTWVARSTASTRFSCASPAGTAPSTCSPSRICTSLTSHR